MSIKTTYTPLSLESLTPSELAHAYLNMTTKQSRKRVLNEETIMYDWVWYKCDVSLAHENKIIIHSSADEWDDQTIIEAIDLIRETKAKEQQRIQEYVQSQDECFQFEYLMQGGILH